MFGLWLLPNGVCKPFVDTIDLVQNPNSKIVDLSADYRFDTTGEWTYGLPELNDRKTIAQAKKISNPGCYATAAQVAIAPLKEYISELQAFLVFLAIQVLEPNHLRRTTSIYCQII